MAKPIHSMIRVLDAARSIDFYNRAFGLDVVGRIAFEEFTLIYLAEKDGSFELELTINQGRTEPYALGDGYGHLAVLVDDVAEAHARIEAAGFSPRPIVEMLHDGTMFARFFFVSDPDGYRIEVLQKAGRFH